MSRLDQDIDGLRESYQELSRRGLASSMLLASQSNQPPHMTTINAKSTVEVHEDDDNVLMESKRLPSARSAKNRPATVAA